MKYKKESSDLIQKKIFISIMMTALFLIITFMFLTYKLYMNNTKKILKDETLLNTKQTVKYIDLVMNNIQHSIDILVSDKTNQTNFQYLNDYVGKRKYAFYNTISNIKSSTSNIQNTIEGIIDVRIYLEKPNLTISNNEGLVKDVPKSNYQINENIMENVHNNRWFNGAELDELLSEESGDIFAFIKPIYSVITGDKQGYVMVMYSKTYLKVVFETTTNAYKIIMNEGKDIILGDSLSDKNPKMKWVKSFIKSQSYNKQTIYEDNNFIIVAKEIPYTTWSVVNINAIELDPIEKLQVIQFGIIMVLLIVVLVLRIMKKLHKSLFLRLSKLTLAMKQVQKGDLSIQINDNINDDLNYIFVNFNKMTTDLQELIDELYNQKILQQEAELKALHNQINPHFIYNIFDNMNWMLQLNRLNALENLIDAVSMYYKSMLAYSTQVISTDHVKLQVDNYLKIQQVRFANKLTYNINFHEIESIDMLNYTLLPLVENAVNHGVEPSIEPCHISVTGWLKHNYLYFTVKDTGVGIDSEKLDEIKKLLSTNAVIKDSRYYGLVNICLRLEGFYKGDFGFDIVPLQRGVEINIRMPINYDGCDLNV